MPDHKLHDLVSRPFVRFWRSRASKETASQSPQLRSLSPDLFPSFDHLPDVPHPASPHVRVPFLGSFYDGDDFLRFPERIGLNVEQVLWIDAGNPSAAHLEVFLQTWLFFGFLVEVFCGIWGLALDQRHFVQMDSQGRCWIVFGNLKQYLEQCIRQVAQKTIPNAEERVKKTAAYLEVVALFVKRHVSTIGKLRHKSPVRKEIGLSIAILGTTLDEATFSLLVQPYPTGQHNWSYFFHFPIPIILDRLQSIGWCPKAISQMEEKFSLNTQYFVSLLSMPDNGLDHSACTDTVCFAENIIEGTYMPAHINAGCTCTYVHVDAALLSAHIGKGAIPLLRVPLVAEEEPSAVEVITVDSDVEYVAISHVWAEGMGNVMANSLPRCQITSIMDAVRSTAQKEHIGQGGKCLGIWMDTFCVPVGPEYVKYRRIAITKMRSIYHDASRVLVFGAALRSFNAPTYPEELMLRVELTTWNRRLWTLEEGAFAHKLCVAFRDHIVNLDQLQHDMYLRDVNAAPFPGASSVTHPLQRNSTAGFILLRHVARGFEVNDGSFTPNMFATAISAARNRNTSKIEDEAVCLAILLGLDTVEMQRNTNPGERMRCLYQQLSAVPESLLFFPGPRLVSDGYKWAPISFLNKPGRHQFSTMLQARLSVFNPQLGLKSSSVRYELVPNLGPDTTDGHTGQVESNMKRIFFRDIETEMGPWYMITRDDKLDNRDILETQLAPTPLPPLQDLIVILEHNHYSSASSLTSGALVRLRTNDSVEQNVKQADYECLVAVRRLSPLNVLGWAERQWPFLAAFRAGRDTFCNERANMLGLRMREEEELYIM